MGRIIFQRTANQDGAFVIIITSCRVREGGRVGGREGGREEGRATVSKQMGMINQLFSPQQSSQYSTVKYSPIAQGNAPK